MVNVSNMQDDREHFIALVKSFKTTLAYAAPETVNIKCDRFINQMFDLADGWEKADAAASDLPPLPGSAS